MNKLGVEELPSLTALSWIPIVHRAQTIHVEPTFHISYVPFPPFLNGSISLSLPFSLLLYLSSSSLPLSSPSPSPSPLPSLLLSLPLCPPFSLPSNPRIYYNSR